MNVGLLPDTRKKSRVGLATCIRRFATIGKGIRKIQLVPQFFFDAFETIALFTPVFPPPAQIARQHSDRLKNCANHRTHEPIVHVYDGKPKGRPRDRGEPRMRRIRPAFEGVIK